MKVSLGAKTIVHPTPVFVVGSYDGKGIPNIMTAAWGGICCSKPPCVAVSLRKARKTYENIMETGAFTISIPSESFIEEADFVGIVSGHRVDKFVTSDLTPVKGTLVNAPYVKEFPHIIECDVLHTIDIGEHVQFIGEIKDVKVDDICLDDKGGSSIEKIMPCLYSTDTIAYYGIGKKLGNAFSIGKKFIK